MRSGVVMGVIFGLGGCASIPENAKYVEPPEGPAVAVVQNWGAMGGATTTCQFPGSSRVCRAALVGVDGKVPSLTGQTTRVEAGEHRVRLHCMAWHGGPMVFGAAKGTVVDMHGPFEAGRRYYVRCELQDGVPRVWLAGAEEGAALAEFGVEKTER